MNRWFTKWEVNRSASFCLFQAAGGPWRIRIQDIKIFCREQLGLIEDTNNLSVISYFDLVRRNFRIVLCRTGCQISKVAKRKRKSRHLLLTDVAITFRQSQGLILDQGPSA